MRTELRCGNNSAAEVTLNRALQDCDGVTEGEGVGSLWAMYIDMAPRAQRKVCASMLIVVTLSRVQISVSSAELLQLSGSLGTNELLFCPFEVLCN